MSLLCSLSGHPIKEPVVSKKTGYIYEKQIIEKYLEINSACPQTGQDMSVEDLMPIKQNIQNQPRIPNQTSIPNLLTIFQNEWDSIMLETYTLKQHLETVRQELSHALYQHDAACRVIARLIKERDHAREQLSKLQTQLKSSMDTEENVQRSSRYLPENIVEDINQKALNLNQFRKERKKNSEIQAQFSNMDEISNFQIKKSIALHSTVKPGITCFEINSKQPNYVATGGNDGLIQIYDQQQEKIINNIEVHKKKINEIKLIQSTDPFLVLSGSDDGLGCLTSITSNSSNIEYKIDQHSKSISSLDLHPLQYLAVAASKDQCWSFHDLSQGKCLGIVKEFQDQVEFNSVKFHPDGHILALGASDGSIKIWNIAEDSLVATLESHNNEIDQISFSENGYYFASCSSKEGIVKIFDLRKLVNKKSLYEEENLSIGAIQFDPSGNFLGVGSHSSFRMINTKNWEQFVKFDAHQDLITSIRFGENTKFIMTSSLDRHLCYYS